MIRNISTQIVRLVVGVLFIISGLIKLNDPIGFSYKLEEYFSSEVLNVEFLIPAALFIACFVVIFEVILGVMLLLGFKTKFTLFNLLGMIVFFTFLTFYSAYFNKVTDCGCFGDALKLTPWESFSKDVILLVLIVFLFLNKQYIQPYLPKKIIYLKVIVSFALCLFMAYYVLNHLPIIDFRAYKVGTNIKKGMETPEGAAKSEYEMVFIYKVNGENKEFPYEEIMQNGEPENGEFVDRIDKLIKQGYVPPIHDFSMEKDGEDYTESILEAPKVVLFISYDLKKSKVEGMEKLNQFYTNAINKNYMVIGLTSSSQEIITQYKKEFNLPFNFYFCDATTLKTIERANPSIVVLNKGTITQKAHFNDSNTIKL